MENDIAAPNVRCTECDQDIAREVAESESSNWKYTEDGWLCSNCNSDAPESW